MQVLEEDVTRRDEYFKEFIMSDGGRVAMIYPTAVHYEDNGQWKEIDNTLKAEVLHGNTFYTNTAGLWDICFPQSLANANPVSITKDGYTVSFSMDGELRINSNVSVASVSATGEVGMLAVRNPEASVAQIQSNPLKDTNPLELSLPAKTFSKLTYPTVYANTAVTYDLDGNRLKESIIIRSYDAEVRGYRYVLNTGGLTPILNEDRSIDLCGPAGAVVMSMAAPFLLDANEAYCDDVQVSLVQSGSHYLLTYTLPQQWLAHNDRAWPVVLDPSVNANQNGNIQDIYVGENSTTIMDNADLFCGYNAQYGTMRTFLRFNRLPFLTSADVITSAKIKLVKADASNQEGLIEVHKVGEKWNLKDPGWEGPPTCWQTVEDTVAVKNAGTYSWDITEIARNWYADSVNKLDDNTGMMFQASNSTVNSGHSYKFYSSNNSTNQPVLTITYYTASGIESYWDSTEVSAGRAGTGYIQNNSGNLVWVHEDLGFDGNRMPVFIKHIYNASDTYDSVTQAGINRFGLGYGWRTNFHQTVTQQPGTTANPIYVWEDGDGTPHSFSKPDGATVYTDLDGLGLTLTFPENDDRVITDKYGNTSTFNSDGRLIEQKNNQVNLQGGSGKTPSCILISYDGNTSKIKEITDGAGRKYKFIYENGLLKHIKYFGNNETEYTHVNFFYSTAAPYLTSIVYKDGAQSFFTYENYKHSLKTVTDIGGYKITFDYNILGRGRPSRVSTITERDNKKSGEEVTGKTISLQYAHNRTTVTEDGKTKTYHFNNYGNTISTTDSEGNSVFYQYDPDLMNQPYVVSKTQNTVMNCFDNSSFENKVSINTFGHITAVWSDADYYMGTKSIKLNCSTASTGGACFEECDVAPGESLTFSAYVGGGSPKIRLRIEEKDSPAAFFESDTTDGSGWQRREVTYTNQSDGVKTITLCTSHTQTGVAYIDCVQVEKSGTARSYNLLQNGYASGNSTAHWVSTSGSVTASNGHFKVAGNSTESRMIYQTVPVSGKAGDLYVLSGSVNGDALPKTEDRNSFFGLKLIFRNTDGTSSTKTIAANPNLVGDSAWQRLAIEASAPKDYKWMTFVAEYSYNTGAAQFDGLQLVKEKFGDRYKYDGNGNVVEATDVLGQTTEYEYDGNDLIETRLHTGVVITNEYDTHHNLIESVETGLATGGSRTTTNTYDSFGNLTKSLVSIEGQVQSTQYTYTSDGNFLLTVNDVNGNTTTYQYDTQTSVLQWVKEPLDGATTRRDYSYDDMYRLVSVTERPSTTATNKLSAVYTYTNDRISKIETPSTGYFFGYGNFGLRTSVNISRFQIVRYQYNDDYNLQELDYGNGAVIRYTYDDQDRVTKEIHCTTTNATPIRTVTYTYGPTGELASVYDDFTEITIQYQYDSFGRLILERKSGSNITTSSVRYGYDTNGNVAVSREYIGGDSYRATYIYDKENRPISVTHTAGAQIDNVNYSSKGTYSYKKLGQIHIVSAYHNNSTDPLLTSTYYYHPAKTGQTSDHVSKLELEATNYSANYQYTYDANGNITKVDNGTSDVTTYEYDSSNRLIRENNKRANKTWAWEYDEAGNITRKRTYSYTTSALTSPTSQDNYAYNETAWRDLLTSYNGNTITYDTIGNMLSDGNYTYTWKYGRQLSRLNYDSGVWNFTYDANGMRTQREADSISTKYTYTYVGDQLTHMTHSVNGVTDATLHFAYHADGKPLAVMYNSIRYYYALNLQGDVVAILTSGGTAVVEYVYDAWGRVIATTGSMDDSLGILNPLRYRGYVYDEETGLYYLQSRYYNPTLGRFISADDIAYLGADGELASYNLFVYCANNPVMGYDPSGNFGIAAIIATGAIVGSLLGVFSAITTGGNVIESAVEGALTGAIGAACGLLIANPFVAVGVAVAGGAAVDFTTQAATQYIKDKEVDANQIDYGRVIKTGLQTGIGTAIPVLGEGAGNTVDAIGTALTWAEGSTLITCVDIAITKFIEATQGESANQQSVLFECGW